MKFKDQSNCGQRIEMVFIYWLAFALNGRRVTWVIILKIVHNLSGPSIEFYSATTVTNVLKVNWWHARMPGWIRTTFSRHTFRHLFQNSSLAIAITRKARREHITSVLKTQQGLPIKQMIVVRLVFSSIRHFIHQPSNLWSLLAIQDRLHSTRTAGLEFSPQHKLTELGVAWPLGLVLKVISFIVYPP